MDEEKLRRAVAENMRRARMARGISLRELAAEIGVSAAMLSQVENATANPTMAVLARIASALGLGFADLTRITLAEPEVLRALDSPDGTRQVRTLFDMHDRVRFELTESRIAAGQTSSSGVHGTGSVEHAYVVAGEVCVTLAEQTWTLGPGDAIRFDGAIPHRYDTAGPTATFLTVIALQED